MSVYLSASCNATYDVVVLDAGFGLLHTCLEFAKAVGDSDLEITGICHTFGIAPSQNVALCGATLIMHFLVEGSVGCQAHGKPILFEERSLQRESIAMIWARIGVDVHGRVTKLPVGIGCEQQFPWEFLGNVGVVEHGGKMLLYSRC